MEYFFVDNGSLRPNSVLQMRKIAQGLSAESGHLISPYGLMHSHKIHADELNGKPADSMQNFLLSPQSDEVDEIRVLPFFLGPSLAITDWLPENLEAWRMKSPLQRKYRILNPLYHAGDNRLSQALSDLCQNEIKTQNFNEKPWVAMVDHGTPLPEVNQVREKVGEQIKQLLGNQIAEFSTCAMERRPDPKYDFNDPLLENLLEKWMDAGVKEVILSQFFLLPGRHAGPGGDLAQICQPFIDRGMKIYRSGNLGAHSLVKEILLDRIRADQKS